MIRHRSSSLHKIGSRRTSTRTQTAARVIHADSRRRWLPSVALLALLQGCGGGAAEPATDAAAPAPVRTSVAKAADDTLELRLPARTEAGEIALLYARATGVLIAREVDLGDRVEAGQILARIAAPEVDRGAQQAEAEVRRAQADEALARLNLQRAEPLAGKGLVSQELLSDRRAAYEIAQAARSAAQAQLATVREQQAFQVVRAPFAGVIAARNVERGDRVIGDQAGTAEPLFELLSLDPLRVIVDVPQSAVLQVRPGLSAEVRFPEIPNESLRAEVVRLARSISGDSGGMRVELRLPNPDDRLPAGMVGEARLRVPRAAKAAIVPVSAVVQGAGGAQVVRLGAGSRLDYRPVKIGRNLGEEIEILDGIAPGDVVVLAPNALLETGSRAAAQPGGASNATSR